MLSPSSSRLWVTWRERRSQTEEEEEEEEEEEDDDETLLFSTLSKYWGFCGDGDEQGGKESGAHVSK